MNPLIARADARRETAHHILSDLQLIERWRAFGNPVLVGAVRYGLPVAPDIDLEIYCDTPRIEDGFEILRDCALHPRIRKARFSNELNGPDQGLYWQLRYQADDGQEWKVDMWSLSKDYSGPSSAAFAESIQQVLTDETRLAVLEIKEWLQQDALLKSPSIHVYRAVIADGVRTPEQFQDWRERNPMAGLISWKPGEI